ncbi:hypothetical protein JOQ06_012053 [Pogonophryne albipinna]|uniref:Uncharacterized protein n=1 Tax=Pogonophryne albipinna TaxID=1090488 RepID=A0AAD6FR14_9TELE|nr:hypothetical protein JOQ06_012053 [Pogonophryne albipinna]
MERAASLGHSITESMFVDGELLLSDGHSDATASQGLSVNNQRLSLWQSLPFRCRQQTDVSMVSLFCLVVGLSAVDGNSSVSQHWLGTRLYHPSSTGSHCRFNDASQYPLPDSVFTNLRCKEAVLTSEDTYEYQQGELGTTPAARAPDQSSMPAPTFPSQQALIRGLVKALYLPGLGPFTALLLQAPGV